MLTCSYAVQEKKYTEDHEWIELDSEGKIGPQASSPIAELQLTDYEAQSASPNTPQRH